MDPHFPGSIIARQGKTAKEFIDGLFFATKGLLLAQVREITGLDTPAIQNWVGRGWVQKPVEKRYTENHLARILIINMLRDVTRLENVAGILAFINGNADSREDDIISESRLYIYLCNILDILDYETLLTPGGVESVIADHVADYEEPFAGAYEKLMLGLKLILTYYAAAVVKIRADALYNRAIAPGLSQAEDEEDESL